MFRSPLALALLAFSPMLFAQVAGMPPSSAPVPTQTSAAAPRRQAPRPSRDEAPGGGPDKVWVNLNSGTYHCPGDRFYGKTANGRYMTEPAAKSAGGKGPRGKNCFGGK